MKEIRWRDEKLYKIAPCDYGGLVQRALGAFVHSVAKGIAIALTITFLLFTPKIFPSFRTWLFIYLPLTLICSVCVAVAHYVCEIEIRPNSVVRYSRSRAFGIEAGRILKITEGAQWTMFGWVDGLSIKGKSGTIFIPAGCPYYGEIKSKLDSWQPILN